MTEIAPPDGMLKAKVVKLLSPYHELAETYVLDTLPRNYAQEEGHS